MTQRLLTFYADDLTGATDAMESFARAGLRTAVFLDVPAPAAVETLGAVDVIGVAGTTRSLSPRRMTTVLRPALTQLAALGARLTQYKVCSTFDSSPSHGSIGHAITVGREAFATRYVPLVVGAPRLGRHTAFGNLFARAGHDGGVYRLDRHPVMRRHPVTPMDESDLRRHLARQTRLPVGLVDIVDLLAGDAAAGQAFDREVARGSAIVLLDVLTAEQLPVVGRLLWDRAENSAPFVVGSSGVGDALVARWGELGLTDHENQLAPAAGVGPILVLSGSASPVTDRQIEHAVNEGFSDIALDLDQLDARRYVVAAVASLRAGTSVILHTARGPDDPRLAAGPRSARGLGGALGRIADRVLAEIEVPRVVVVGGDTSTVVARALGVTAVAPMASAAPGAPLCRVYAPGTRRDGLEMALKGGQIGTRSYFVEMRDGVAAPLTQKELMG